MIVSRTALLETLSAVQDTVSQLIGDLNESEIKDIEDYLGRICRHLRCSRNALVSINKLPSEILGYIFQFIHADFASPSRSWIEVSYVCRHWRRVALSMPSLWSVVDLRQKGFDVHKLEAFVQRSKAAPLTVFYQNPPSDHLVLRALQDVVARNMYRVRHMHVKADVCPPFSDVILSEPAPSLCSLSLWHKGPAFPLLHANSARALFDGRAPLLRKMTISACALWYVYRITSLTHLALYNSEAHWFGDSFVDMLDGCQQLEMLFIVSPHLRLATEVEQQHSNRIVTLPRLHLFYIVRVVCKCYPLPWLRHLLAHLEIPEYCDFRVEFWMTDREVVPEGSILSIFPPPAQFHPLEQVATVKLLTTSTSKSCIAVHSKTLFIVAHGDAFPLGLPNDFLCPIARIVIVNNTETTSFLLWRTLLSTTTHLKTLDVFEKYLDTVEFIQLLCPDLGAEGVSPVRCPGLQTVNWACLSYPDVDLLFGLMAMANDRAHCGSPMRAISIWPSVNGEDKRTVEFDSLGAPMGYFTRESTDEDCPCLHVVEGLIAAATPKRPDEDGW
ncbi:hypothetical protein BD626DRAFT_574202 [Schizophyllum amplum]|uniref:F-box domain-containing protein n=1 Tax=Schizophyllum amplum TaxID=97359 RepID=A0A550BYT6_9AGAR|nr:hypothetical protein BD626DRAFT_574202 [Auriculariopsis ampla]